MFGILKYLDEVAKNENSQVLYLLSLVVVAMIIDFLMGYLAAWINKEVVSQKGVNGIIRKVASIMLLVLAVPVAPVIPSGVGTAALYVLYFGYLIMELSSIVENYRKLGLTREASLLVKFFGMLNEKKEDKNE
ncbi:MULTISPECIES: phage holin family protein [unclassified Granulicatella]|uniref:phage holin family protein n=1 Tax=unclassified Granulicatella TaxID=2630493 RepID=UPI001073477E|nr:MULTISPECIES: phage holin family protein [unclassified Granulicatella]MBF0779803.1 phage holin family protein [Granulicatella sp. 19428wC4_WM01]TFU96205.1 holin [Granulicatella sp. WM01]